MGPSIQWVQSYVTGDKILCVYKAENEELLKEHAKKWDSRSPIFMKWGRLTVLQRRSNDEITGRLPAHRGQLLLGEFGTNADNDILYKREFERFSEE